MGDPDGQSLLKRDDAKFAGFEKFAQKSVFVSVEDALRGSVKQTPNFVFVAGYASIPPGITDEKILAHSELVALDQGHGPRIRPGAQL